MRVHWQLDGDELRIDADIPADTSARIVFPDGSQHTAGPGRFRAGSALLQTSTTDTRHSAARV
ncbi:hypothetical protein [Arthrobacter sp. NA-172]|uniref:hypothetical protein n=1 Tax=Arthrobacter sp. NA-172 TaxID=3367524 RepID=UPI0037552990